jgi:DNA/RNA-binding domain of Phe-tRNA-synthetase-like protein
MVPPQELLIANRVPVENPAGGLHLGVVRAEGVDPGRYPEGFSEALGLRLAEERRGEHPPGIDTDARRTASRDMLRNGRYKPTGRGKPASEYLVRAAAEGFPAINSLVDVNNLISLQERLPITMWDVNRVGSYEMVFRLGRDGETYVFNRSGQVLDVRDLVVGCRITPESGAEGEPVVSPIKDSELAKTGDDTDDVVACVYAPVNVVSDYVLSEICTRFAGWLQGCGAAVRVTHATVAPGKSVRL